jgi:hypothetical protein
MVDATKARDLQEAQPVRLATEEMASLWKAATGVLLHGPRCTCVGFGMMHRSGAELERDIAEFLLAKYEDRGNEAMVRLFTRWIDECASGGGETSPGVRQGLLQWIDRNATSMDISAGDMREIGADVRALLRSMAAQAGEFTCS